MELPKEMAAFSSCRFTFFERFLIPNSRIDIDIQARKTLFTQSDCLPTIVSRPVDNYEQAYRQLSTGLHTIVGKQID